MRKELTIGIAGAGGDGVVAMGSLLQNIAAKLGYYSQMPRYYGAQIRGGASAVKLGLNVNLASLPKEAVDILVCFDWQKYSEVKKELQIGPETMVFCEKQPPIELPTNTSLINFTLRSQESTQSGKNKNIVALGLLLALIGFQVGKVQNISEAASELSLVKTNWPAVLAGIELATSLSTKNYILAIPDDETPTVIVHGNAVMARAAIRAGCHAYFGYPITPAAEIMQEMQKRLPSVAGIFLQAEDEIASASLMVGTSLTGAKTMTGTSGPGLDLMTEILGLAVSAEIPLVIIDVQRCGPSTGIPSKSEQSDLNHAIYGGHGDGPRVVIAAHDIESCFRLTIESFNIAEQFQVPVILLSDQWLGQTYVGVNGSFLEQEYNLVERKRPIDASNYHRYQISHDRISPMANVGDPLSTYQTSGLTHNIDGAPAFDSETHQKLHEKRWLKLLPLSERKDLVAFFGNEKSRKGIITWGSSAQVVLKVIGDLGLHSKVKVCVPELLHPLPSGVERFLESIDKLLVVEMNYTGQLHHYLRSQVDLPQNTKTYTRAGGRPFSSQELSSPIAEVAK